VSKQINIYLFWRFSVFQVFQGPLFFFFSVSNPTKRRGTVCTADAMNFILHTPDMFKPCQSSSKSRIAPWRCPLHWLRSPDQSIAANLSALQVSFWGVTPPGGASPTEDPRVFKARFLTALSGSAFERHVERQQSWKAKFWRWARERASWWRFESRIFLTRVRKQSVNIIKSPHTITHLYICRHFRCKSTVLTDILPSKSSQTERAKEGAPSKTRTLDTVLKLLNI